IEHFARAHPGIGVCSQAGPGDLVRELRAAQRSGALLLCRGAGAAAASGLPAGQIVVTALPGSPAARAAVLAGWATLVDADQAAAAAQAAAAVIPAGPALAGPALAGTALAGTALAGTALAGTAPDGTALAGTALAGTAPDGADADPAAVAAVAAIAAISSWLEVTFVATRDVRAVRRALDMTASVRGTRPPARTVRGLA
ncbi:MAG: hypothetical protein ACLP52_13225, partial [Streptosporangiaceae bacterium]